MLKKYAAKCVYCGRSRRDGVKLHVDHIKPRSKYPQLALEFSNFQVLCENCNPENRILMGNPPEKPVCL
ncbi:HNH endonuclease [Scandinavium hiltneri]|uniref:HNH endonuclease n=1 Tax=Scandinavium hiltneri TaxID=2926519 RepID=UPI0035B33DFD